MFRQKGKIITRQRVRVFIEGAQPAVLAKSPLQICYNGLRQKNGGGVLMVFHIQFIFSLKIKTLNHVK
jgi:hypothetical protein